MTVAEPEHFQQRVSIETLPLPSVERASMQDPHSRLAGNAGIERLSELPPHEAVWIECHGAGFWEINDVGLSDGVPAIFAHVEFEADPDTGPRNF